MVQSEAKTVAAYLKTLPPERRAVVSKLRAMIRKLSPRVKEAMQYGMPGFAIGGESFCALNAQKNYYSLYVCSTELTPAMRKTLGKVDCGKCCIRFRKEEDLNFEAAQALLASIVAEAEKKIQVT